jgi:hypothetical protein
MGSLVSLVAVAKERSLPVTNPNFHSARPSLLAYCETANSSAFRVLNVVTSKNRRWRERVAFTGKQMTHIHGEEITGKAERLQRWEDNLKITFTACKVSR